MSIQIEHAMPGRIRLRVDKLKHNPDFAKVLEDLIQDAMHPKKLRFNLTIGGLVVEFDPKLPATVEKFSQLFDALRPDHPKESAQFKTHLVTRLHAPGHGDGISNLPQDMGSYMGALNREVRTITLGITDLKTLVPLTLLTLGVGTLLLADPIALPAWYDYLWFAFGTYVAFYGVSKVTA